MIEMALNPTGDLDLRRALDAVDVHSAAAKEFVRAAEILDPALRQLPCAPGKWTPQQELAHIILTCREFTAAILRGSEFELMVSTELAARNHATVLRMILRGDSFTSGAEAPPRVRPRRSMETVPVLIEQLKEARRQLEHAVVFTYGTDPDRLVRHPYFGLMHLPELLELLAAHMRHHGENIARLHDPGAV